MKQIKKKTTFALSLLTFLTLILSTPVYSMGAKRPVAPSTGGVTSSQSALGKILPKLASYLPLFSSISPVWGRALPIFQTLFSSLGKKATSSSSFVSLVVPPPTPPAMASLTVPTEPVPANVTPVAGPYVEQIATLAGESICAAYSWKNRGLAPAGYVKGVALSFARSFCRIKKAEFSHSAVSSLLGERNTFNSGKDALAYYQNSLSNILDVTTSPLKAVYVLGMGLGMRESSGAYCEGWDKSAGSNRSASAAEAGVFQTSFDSMIGNPVLGQLYTEYLAGDKSRCFLEEFKEGVHCGGTSILGAGAAADYQAFNKSCPAFATEYAMLMLRTSRSHYGPINRKEVEVVPACDELLQNVQDLIEQDSENACRDIN